MLVKVEMIMKGSPLFKVSMESETFQDLGKAFIKRKDTPTLSRRSWSGDGFWFDLDEIIMIAGEKK